jgi:hydroxymethylpyrimidine pyrophosphatase-like HAD family hydrolase
MTTLPAPLSPSAILSFDFDGTLHHSAGDPPVPVAFFDLIRQLREEQGVVWGINTGRSMPHMVEGFIESRFPFLPDWVVAREREIYFPTPLGRWLPHPEWNDRCELEIGNLFNQTRHLLLSIRQQVEEHTGAQWIEMDGEPAGVISQSEDEMEWIVQRIQPLVAAEPHLTWQRNSIYLRFGHRQFQKGSSLVQISKHYALGSDRCFAIGDSHNDFEMLDPSHAGMTACPANAVPAIKDRITANGGLVTSASHGHGSIEALKHYFIQS